MNKYQKEIENLLAISLEDHRKELASLYSELSKEITKEILQLSKEIEADDKFSKKLQKERLEAIRNQMDVRVAEVATGEKKSLYDYLQHVGETSFNELFYEFEMSEKVPVSFNFLSEQQLNVIINTPVASRKLSTRLKGNTNKMKKSLNRVLTRGFGQGWSFQKMARQISEIGGASYRRGLTIARTEGGRVSSITKQQSQDHAKKLGIKLKKRWVSALDGRTRDTHRKLDGQIRGVDEYFEVGGLKALQPHMFGIASEDCNCRCTTIAELDGYENTLRRDNETGETIEYKTYQDWAGDKKMRESGAVYGAIDDRDPGNIKKLDKFAKSYYHEVLNRDRDTEISAIAANATISSLVAEQIFNHIFVNQYPLNGKMQNFYPDYDMARSWQRLREGKNIQKHDILMLEHELFESILMADGMDYREAHLITNELYNYQVALNIFKYGKE